MPRRSATVTTGARIESPGGRGFCLFSGAFRTAEAMSVMGIANLGGTTKPAIIAPLVPIGMRAFFVCPSGRRGDGIVGGEQWIVDR